jgi:hypothetical protein
MFGNNVRLLLVAFLAILQGAEATQPSFHRGNGLQGDQDAMASSTPGSLADSIRKLQNEDKEFWDRVLAMSSSMSMTLGDLSFVS